MHYECITPGGLLSQLRKPKFQHAEQKADFGTLTHQNRPKSAKIPGISLDGSRTRGFVLPIYADVGEA
jgi:hypothetical protein